MTKSKPRAWMTLLTSGLGVALLTFAANKLYETVKHHEVGPKYVEAAIRVEDDKLLVFVRNQSDEPLDLKSATITLAGTGLAGDVTLGAYPEVSKLYTVKPTSGSASVALNDQRMVVTLQIAQAIAPKSADQFGVALAGTAGPLDLSNAQIRVEFVDLKGQRYEVKR